MLIMEFLWKCMESKSIHWEEWWNPFQTLTNCDKHWDVYNQRGHWTSLSALDIFECGKLGKLWNGIKLLFEGKCDKKECEWKIQKWKQKYFLFSFLFWLYLEEDVVIYERVMFVWIFQVHCDNLVVNVNMLFDVFNTNDRHTQQQQ